MAPRDPGETIDDERFEVRRRIGSGGMGVVYAAFDRERGTEVALKTLQHADPTALYHFKREFRLLADVSHPNLVALHELVASGERWFFTMELVDGVDFLAHVRPGDGAGPEPAELLPTVPSGVAVEPAWRPPRGRGSLRLERLRPALRQLAAGVAALHDAGQLHRDVKPSNVLVTPQGRVVLLDFGLVREIGTASIPHSLDNEIVGTPAYMAPEQACGQPLSPASDWYSVGVLLYEALTGQRPFSGTMLEILQDKQLHDPPAARLLAPDVPEDLDALCADLLHRRPDARPDGATILRRLEAASAAPSLATSSRPSGSASAALLLGRERHLAALADALAAVARDGRPVAVHLRGASGMGKTALLRRFLRRLAQRDGRAVVLAGRCYEQESVPYKAFDSLVDALSVHLAGLPRLEAEALLPRDVSALARVFPVLRRVQAISEARRPAGEPGDLLELRRRAFSALREVLGRLADRRPLVLSIDDLQWGDPDSAALFSALLRPPDPPALLLLASCREGAAAADPVVGALRGAGAAVERRELVVGPLSDEDARALACRLIGDDAPSCQALGETIAREAGGSPLLVIELARHAREAGAAPRPDGAMLVSLGEVIAARLERMPAAARRLLEVVAVAGTAIAQKAALRAAGIPAGDRSPLVQLRLERLVQTRGSRGLDPIEVHNGRVRDVVLATVSPDERRACHRGVAEALEALGEADPELLSTHFAAGGEPVRAAVFAARAADRAAEALAFERAARLYRRALELPQGDDAVERRLRAQLGQALANAGRGAEAARELLAAARHAPPPDRLALELRAADQLLRSGELGDGLRAIRQVLGSMGIAFPATARGALASALLRRTRLRLRGLGHAERRAGQLLPERLARIDAHWSVAQAIALVDPIQGIDFATRHLLLALDAGEPMRVARGLAGELVYLASLGRGQTRRGRRVAAMARDLRARADDPNATAMCLWAEGFLAYVEGRWGDAVERFEPAVSLLRDHCTGAAFELNHVESFLLWSLSYRGELAAVQRRVRLRLHHAHERGDRHAVLLLSSGWPIVSWLMADDVDGAARALTEGMRGWPDDRFLVQHFFELHAWGLIDLYAGRGRAAWARIEARWPALRRSFLLRIPQVRVEMLHLRARSALAAALDGGDEPPRLLARAERDARRLQRGPLAWARPSAELVLGAIARARGDFDRARAHLDQAVAGYDLAAMPLHGAVARLWRGQQAGAAEGGTEAAEAARWMAEQGVQLPERLARALAPGYERAEGAKDAPPLAPG